jgi:DNA-binding SARP family transcriptional activator/tetratricopeptide (TPR) repeat protein
MLRGNRFRLITLGRLTLVGAGGEEDASLARRRQKLAILAMLAMARRPLARDSLLEMFWGEQDETRARHSLSNALSELRRTLGQGSITTRDTEVALTADAPIDVDALDLADAMEAGDAARAVDTYGGPFLDGVHIEDSPGFDQWVFRERRRIETLFLEACARQCATLARVRRWPECHVVAARWLDTEPLSGDAARFLLEAARGPGTRVALAAALDEYERLRTRLRREFDLAPEPAVVALADEIREQIATHAGAADATVPADASPAPPPDIVAPPAAEPPPAAVIPAATARPPRLTRWRIAGIVAAAAIAATFIVARRFDRPSAETPATRKPSVAILAMNVRAGDSALAWLADGLPEMITGKLAHVGSLDIVSPAQVRAVLARSGRTTGEIVGDTVARDLARRIGATLMVVGAVGRDGHNLVLDLTVRDVGSGNLLTSGVLTRADPLALADEAAVRVLDAANVAAPGPQLTPLETSSVEAYQHYIRALDASRAGRHSEAVRELEAAIAIDSGFIPVLRLRTGYALGDADTALVRRLHETMRRYASHATAFDRLELEAYYAYYGGERERSEALARELARRYPRDPRAYQFLQDILGAHGAFAEAERAAIAAIALDSLAIEAGTGPCTFCSVFSSLINLRWIHTDWDGAAGWARRWIRAQPDAASAWAGLAWTLSYARQPDSALALMQRALTLSGNDRWAIDEMTRMLLVARRYEAADSAIAALEKASPGTPEPALDLRGLLERERGHIRASTRVFDRLAAEVPTDAGFAELMRADNLRLLGDYAGAARRLEAPAHTPGSTPLRLPLASGAARTFCWHHALASDAYAAVGDTVLLRAVADSLDLICDRSYYGRDWRLSHHIRGLIALRAGRYAEAETELRAAVWTPMEGWGRTIVQLAAAQSALGRPNDAIATLRTGYATRLNAMGRYVPISELDLHMARAFAQAGNADSARVYASYVRRAWRTADPEVKRLLAQLPPEAAAK